jgi:hypothetical protein
MFHFHIIDIYIYIYTIPWNLPGATWHVVWACALLMWVQNNLLQRVYVCMLCENALLNNSQIDDMYYFILFSQINIYVYHEAGEWCGLASCCQMNLLDVAHVFFRNKDSCWLVLLGRLILVRGGLLFGCGDSTGLAGGYERGSGMCQTPRSTVGVGGRCCLLCHLLSPRQGTARQASGLSGAGCRWGAVALLNWLVALRGASSHLIALLEWVGGAVYCVTCFVLARLPGGYGVRWSRRYRACSLNFC